MPSLSSQQPELDPLHETKSIVFVPIDNNLQGVDIVLMILNKRLLNQRPRHIWSLVNADRVDDHSSIFAQPLEGQIVGEFVEDIDLERAAKGLSWRGRQLFVHSSTITGVTAHLAIGVVAFLLESQAKGADISLLQLVAHNGLRDIFGKDIGNYSPVELIAGHAPVGVSCNDVRGAGYITQAWSERFKEGFGRVEFDDKVCPGLVRQFSETGIFGRHRDMVRIDGGNWSSWSRAAEERGTRSADENKGLVGGNCSRQSGLGVEGLDGCL